MGDWKKERAVRWVWPGCERRRQGGAVLSLGSEVVRLGEEGEMGGRKTRRSSGGEGFTE
jgi:hypothetical protein